MFAGLKPDVLATILLGGILILAFRLMPQPGVMPVTAATADDLVDYWMTPYYLRYNTAIPAPGIAALLPVPANYTYALGVPSQPYTQATVTSS